MRSRLTTRIGTLAACLAACCSYAYGQPCEPEWDTTVGNPGVSLEDGSIYVLRAFDDGTGEMLYAGGSFSIAAGQPGTSRIARWHPVLQSWSSVGGGLNDGWVNAFVPFDAGSGPELVVGGTFQGAFGVPDTQCIAKWDGIAWSSLGAAMADGFVSVMTTWDGPGGDRLYVGGRFPTVGGVTANGIAYWDGVQWHSMGAGITGWNEYVDAMMVWDDGSGEKLYVGGRFDTMDGLNTPLVARWDGTSWEQVGSGLINDNIMFGLESMAIYDDGSGPALYVGGYEFHAPGQPLGNVSKWDGQQWTTVGPRYDGRCTDLCVFDDGNGPGLYRSGTAFWELGYFARLVGDDWEMVGGGVTTDPYGPAPWPSTFALYAWDDALYVGGFFNRAGGFQGVGGEPCESIAAWGCPVSACPADINGDNVVDVLDLLALLAAWGNPGGPEDINGDGTVDVLDLLELLAAWGPCFPSGACCIYTPGVGYSCEDLTEFDCLTAGGYEWAEGEECATYNCPTLPEGACCFYPFGDCLDLNSIECAAQGGNWEGAGTACATTVCPVLPPGDVIENAIPVPGLPFSDVGDTTAFGDDYDEVCPYSGSTANDVVYAYTPAAGETIDITLCADSLYDTKLYVYENMHTPGLPFACNDDECTTPAGQQWVSELLGLILTGGNTYYIVVDGYGGSNGIYTLDIN